MFITAIKPQTEVLDPSWWPSEPRLGETLSRCGRARISEGAAEFALRLVSRHSRAHIAVSIPAAYALSRYRFAGRGAFRQFLLVSQMLSPIVLVLGLFRLVVGDRHDRQHQRRDGRLRRLQHRLLGLDAAELFRHHPARSRGGGLDRGREPLAQTLVEVFLPLAVPAIVVTAIFTFINAWNEFVIALTMLRQQESYTLPIQIFSLVAGRYTVEWHLVMAATFAATIPVAVVFSWLQRYLVRGLALGAVK